ncbi:hypothetical protein [Brachybacterium sp. Marseille-Q7125]|uniref:hypothetical protein n=1 Tax=Brachybacterium sp. Marseille-Q7125 TaxID=2932815 RepID=UPI001FF53B7F|nr:hypothetical protein [Brachybacterium sp. Marseille-Q7125]
MTAPELDICLVSGADEIRYRSYVNHAAYARLHGLDYRLECGIGPDIQNAFYYKLQAIRNVLPRYDWIVWIDDDCYITDIHSDRIRTLIHAAEANGEVLVVAEGPVEPNGFWSTLNSGVFALRNDSDGRELLDLIATAPIREVEQWWDTERDGTFTGGDQDAMIWALREALPHLWERTRIVGYRELNARPHHYTQSLQDAFIVHFAGYPDKVLGVIDFARGFAVGQELLPQKVLDDLHVQVCSPVGAVEQVVRRARWKGRSAAKRWVRRSARYLPASLYPRSIREKL